MLIFFKLHFDSFLDHSLYGILFFASYGRCHPRRAIFSSFLHITMFRLICLIQKRQKAPFCIRQCRNHHQKQPNQLFINDLQILTIIELCRLIQISLNRQQTGQQGFLLHDRPCLKHEYKSSWCLHLYDPSILEWFEYHIQPRVNESQTSV